MNDIGQSDPFCPHCGGELQRFPARKMACPHCKGDIHSRTRPNDRAKILVRPDQLEELEALWAAANERLDSIRLYANHFPEEFAPIVAAIQSGAVPLDEVDDVDMFALAMKLSHERTHDGLLVETCPWCWPAIDDLRKQSAASAPVGMVGRIQSWLKGWLGSNRGPSSR
jgi:hypothetical protein